MAEKAKAKTVNEIKPQPGFQTMFLSSPADITIGGGAAGCGKTFAEIIEPLRNIQNPKFGAIFFRRTTPQIRTIGGLLDESKNVYTKFNAKLNDQMLTWGFPSGATMKFNHLEYEKNIYDHQGAQYPLEIFDELTHFTKKQFFYLLSRNRSTCGVKPYTIASCNPDPESWLAEFLEWWIDQETGYPIQERAGKLRYFTIDKDNYIWGNSPAEVVAKVPYIFEDDALKDVNIDQLIKSVTFVPGNIYQNKILLAKNPNYLSNLLSQDEVEKMRLLGGNWKKSLDGLSLFDFEACRNLFSNFPEKTEQDRFITCDAARFGANLAVIFTWVGWEVIRINIFTKSPIDLLGRCIEREREVYLIPKSQVLIDQDGLGGGLVDYGKYKGFSGGDSVMIDPSTKIVENYYNLKTQCFYKLADKINKFNILIHVEPDSVFVDGQPATKVKVGNKTYDIKELIIRHLRCIKRKITDGDGKLRINSKEEQKAILGNDESPDFADNLMMRAYFEYKHPQKLQGEIGGFFF